MLHVANTYDLHAVNFGIWWVVVIDVNILVVYFQLSVDKTT